MVARFRTGRMMGSEWSKLEAVRARIDALDAELMKLVDERSALARKVGEIKREAGNGQFGLRPAREAQLIKRLLKAERQAARPEMIVRLWRELIGESLSIQGQFHLSVWGGRNPARTVELARLRFGGAPPLAVVADPETALAAARTPGGVAVLALEPNERWWGRLLAEPQLSIFASLPCLTTWGGQAALAVAAVATEPSGLDETYWVTDATGPASTIEAALEREGVAARLILDVGGLKLFGLPGYFQREDELLARAPGRLTGVIGSAPAPFDL
jgi:chorismate mutase